MPQQVDATNPFESPQTFQHRGADHALRVRRPAPQSTASYSSITFSISQFIARFSPSRMRTSIATFPQVGDLFTGSFC